MAITQVLQWKYFLSHNPDFVTQFLPASIGRSTPLHNIEYTIVMGRRTEDPREAEWRQFLSSNHGVQIRSYDYLTEELGTGLVNLFYVQDCAPAQKLTRSQLNALANPFHAAWSFATWKQFCRQAATNAHVVAANAEHLLQLRTYSDRFGEYLSSERQKLERLGLTPKDIIG